MKKLIIISSLALLVLPISSYSKESGSLKRCQNIIDKIQSYSDKRRRGGSAIAMQGWRKKRNNYNALYFEYNCQKHRKALQ
tara:strand:+ start:6050 stop:6292 length:243 start_codon:yes stop_codon:yes gene_type:complete